MSIGTGDQGTEGALGIFLKEVEKSFGMTHRYLRTRTCMHVRAPMLVVSPSLESFNGLTLCFSQSIFQPNIY